MSQCFRTVECFLESHWEVFFEALFKSNFVVYHDFL